MACAIPHCDVAPGEERAANVLTVGGSVIVPASFPETAGILLMKAEAGVTCSSLIFEA